MKRYLLLAVSVLGFMLGAAAETYNWNNTTTSAAQDWLKPANWKTAAGEVATDVPTNAADNAVFPKLVTPANAYSQASLFTRKTNPMSDVLKFSIDSISDTDKYSRRNIQFDTWDYSECWTVRMLLELKNPDNFHGFFSGTGEFYNGGGLRFRMTDATASHTPIIHNLSVNKRMAIEVPNAGTKTVVESIYEGGVLTKEGNGELELRHTPGKDLLVHLNRGTISFRGRGTGVDMTKPPVDGAVLWLDASRTSTMTTKKDGDYTFINKWSDPRGEAYPYAYYDDKWKRTDKQLYLVGNTSAPFLNYDRKINGMPVVDFGRTSGDTDVSLGPTNCYLTLSQIFTNVREVFVVSRLNSTAGACTILGDDSKFPFHPYGQFLVNTTYGSSCVAAGRIICDGKPAGASNTIVYRPERYTVVSVGATNVISQLSLLGSDRMYETRVGGCRIAEILFYAKELTNDERLMIQHYLMEKWRATESELSEAVDAAVVTIDSDDDAISVPSGRSAFVPEVYANSGTLVKKGAGHLKIGELGCSINGAEGVASIDVKEGTIEFGGVKAVDSSKPAGNPYLWLIADEKYMTFSNTVDAAGNKYVQKWVDVRDWQTAHYARPAVEDSALDFDGKTIPTYVPNAVDGKGVIDFGTYGPLGKGSYFRVEGLKSTRMIYDIYMAQTLKTGTGTCYVFTDSSVNCSVDVMSALVNPEGRYATTMGRAATTTFNGAVVDPITAQSIRRFDTYDVVSLSSPMTVSSLRIGNKMRISKEGTPHWGGMRCGEWLYYTNRLSAAERRQTSAYLTKRWKGFDTPAIKQSVKSITFAKSAAANIVSERDIKIGEIKGSNGNIVINNQGDTQIGGGGLPDKPSIKLESGNLDLNFDLLQKPAYYFDATREDTMDLEYNWVPTNPGSTADKVARTNVNRWRDANGNGIYADAQDALDYAEAHPVGSLARVYRKPVLRTLETASGIYRNFVYFGGPGGPNTGDTTTGIYGTTDQAAMFFNRRFDGTDLPRLAEFHTVFTDASKSENHRRGQPFHSRESGNGFLRGEQTNPRVSGSLLGALLANPISKGAAYLDVLNGYVAQDGVEMTMDQRTNVVYRGIHLLSFVPLSNSSTVDALCYLNKGQYTGGTQIGMQICFENKLSEGDRKLLTNAMMKKWFGKDFSFCDGNFRTLDLADGTTCTVSGEYIPSEFPIMSLKGGGTFIAPKVSGVNRISSACRKDGTWQVFSVGGSIKFADEVTVVLDPVRSAYPQVGIYPIVAVNGKLENVDLTQWKIQQTMATPSRIFSLVAENKSVSVKVRKPGAIAIFR